MAQSGSNLTGVNVLAAELDAKRLEILHEVITDAQRIGSLGESGYPEVDAALDAATRQLALDLVRGITRGPDDVTRALDMLESAHVDAVNVLDGPVNYTTRAKIIEQLNRRHVPAIYAWPQAAEEGRLLGYGNRLFSSDRSPTLSPKSCKVRAPQICRSRISIGTIWSLISGPRGRLA